MLCSKIQGLQYIDQILSDKAAIINAIISFITTTTTTTTRRRKLRITTTITSSLAIAAEIAETTATIGYIKT